MAAIHSEIPSLVPMLQFRRRTTTLALAGVVLGLSIAIGAFLLHGSDANAARFAAMTVFRASGIAFLLFYLAGPLSRLVPSRPTLTVARERTGLALAFAGIYLVFLACTVAPSYFASRPVPLTTLTFALFSTVILAAVLAGERAGRAGAPWRASLRAMEVMGVAYFWTVYAVSDLDHLYGPHRPDGYFGASLSILVVALLIRFADSFRQRWSYAQR